MKLLHQVTGPDVKPPLSIESVRLGRACEQTKEVGGRRGGGGGGLFLEESEGRKARKDLEVRFGVGPRCHTNGDFLK